MDLRRKAQRWVSVICCTVLFLSAVQVPARRDAAAAQSPPGEGAGQRLAYIGSDDNLWLMNADGSGRTQLTQAAPVSTLAWAPDGQRIAFARLPKGVGGPPGADLLVVGASTRQQALLIEGLDARIWTIAWTPDGTRLALLTYGWPDGTARVLEVDVGTGAMAVLDSWLPPAMGVGFPFITSGVAWSPDGKVLLVYGYPAHTEILTVDAGAVTRKVALGGSQSTESLKDHACLCPRWSPDGSLIACHDFDSILVVTPDGDLVHEFPALEGGWQSPAWSPDGARIATGGPPGLSMIDLRTGGESLLVSREAWEPSWSPDGQYLTFSMVEGLGSDVHQELQGVGVIGADGQGLQVLDGGSHLALWQPLQVAPEPACGTWDGSVSDERIELTRISESSGDECRGAFLFSNETGLWSLGGYILELESTRLDNANAVWITLLDPPEGRESIFLLPSLDMELHTLPVDVYSGAQVTVRGEVTLDSITRDTALFLLRTALALAPGGSCLVPEEQLAYAAFRVLHIVTPAVELAWEGDLVGAGRELRQLLPEFLDRSSTALRDVGVDCGAEALKSLIGKPAVIAKLVVAYLTWVPVAIYDYFKYGGRPVYATLVYEVPEATEPIVPRIHWTAPQRIGGMGQGGPTQQLLLDREGRLWAFWEEHLQQSSAELMYDAVHYRVWEQNTWGNLEDIPGSENYGEPSAVVLPSGRILVKAESPGEAPYGWFLWNGYEWSTVPQMSLVKQASEPIRILAADGHGSLHLLGLPVRTWDGESWRETGSLGSAYFHGAAVDTNGNLHVVSQGPASDQTVRMEHRTWDGDAWSAPQTVYTVPGEPQTRTEPPALAIGTCGVLHVAWASSHWEVVQSGTVPPAPHWLSYTRGDGGQWSEPETIFGPLTVDAGFWAPAIQVTPDGMVVIVWADVRLGGSNRVYVTWGRQGQWAEPLVLSLDDGNDYHWPDLEIDSFGNIHVLWSSVGGGVYHVVGPGKVWSRQIAGREKGTDLSRNALRDDGG